MAQLFRFLSSLRLTVACLACAIVLIFVGTLAQVELGIYAAQAKYFRSLFVFWELPGSSLRIPVLPGGYLVGGVLVINLICAHARRFGLRKDKLGLALIHFGLILLLLGQLATDLFQVESTMRLREGQSKSFSEDSRHYELAILDTTNPDHDRVVTIPEPRIARGGEIRDPDLALTVKVLHYWRNSRNVPPDSATEGPVATQGVGKQVKFVEVPVEARPDRRNVPTAYVELIEDGHSLGTWVVSAWLDDKQTFTAAGRAYEIALRPRRYYRPFEIELLDFSHDKYMGTEIPKNFSSRVRVKRPETKEDREVLIYMNHPLRYGGETFYQSGYDERDPRVTILQVVRNPGWLAPYLSCTLISVGLLVQFMIDLLRFVRRRKQPLATK